MVSHSERMKGGVLMGRLHDEGVAPMLFREDCERSMHVETRRSRFGTL